MTGKKNPLHLIKDTAVGAASAVAGAAGSAIGLAQGAAGAGRTAAGRLADRRRAAGADDDTAPGKDVADVPAGSAAQESESSPPQPDPDAVTDAVRDSISRGEPVNVTEELGLDPAPVAKPKGPRTTTRIDDAADPEKVDVTPADVAGSVARDHGGARPAD